MKSFSFDNWSKDERIKPFLFFVQSMEEMLFPYGHDSYRVPTLNFHYLCVEIVSSIENAISAYKKMMSDGVYDSLNSAHLVKEFLFKDNLPINYDLRHQPRSQDLPDIAALNFALNIISRDKMIDCKNVVGYHPNIYLIDEVEATDIDNPIDFDFAEFVYKRKLAVGGANSKRIISVWQFESKTDHCSRKAVAA